MKGTYLLNKTEDFLEHLISPKHIWALGLVLMCIYVSYCYLHSTTIFHPGIYFFGVIASLSLVIYSTFTVDNHKTVKLPFVFNICAIRFGRSGAKVVLVCYITKKLCRPEAGWDTNRQAASPL
ncbi:MAG: hypothetical protein GY738_19920 [Pseudoalteromonas sp.]|nr:hypothetical protein [Pseudoalteromonas sp.]